MKTLKFFGLAMLLSISVMSFSKPVPAAKNAYEAKKELLRSIKSNMYRWNVTRNIEEAYNTEYVVYCSVNEQNKVEIVRIDGEVEELKDDIISLMKNHPVEASSLLRGKILSFRLQFVAK